MPVTADARRQDKSGEDETKNVVIGISFDQGAHEDASWRFSDW